MTEVINYLWGFHNQQDEIRKLIVLTLKVLGETVPHQEEADIQEVMDSYSAKLTGPRTADCHCSEEMSADGGQRSRSFCEGDHFTDK